MGTATAPMSWQAKSAVVHSGRFSPRMATRSPLAIPQARRACATPETLRQRWREDLAPQQPCGRWSVTRGLSRLTIAKKMSLRVAMLIPGDVLECERCGVDGGCSIEWPQSGSNCDWTVAQSRWDCANLAQRDAYEHFPYVPRTVTAF